MRRTTKKIISLLMAVAMVFTMSGMTAMATDTEDDYGVSSLSETYDEYSAGVDSSEDYVSTDKLDSVDEVQSENASSEAAADIQGSGETVDYDASEGSETESAPDTSMEYQEDTESVDSAEEEASEEEEEAPLIYQKLTANVTSGNAGIATMSAIGGKVTLEGVMPEGAYIKAEPVEVEIDGIAVLAAYDITIYDADGEEYQPQDGAIRVHIENDAIRDAENEDNPLFVYHMKDKYAEPEKIPVIMTENGSVEFDANEFSIYVVGEDDELYEADHETQHYIYTVNFYIEDMSEDPISSQTLSAGEYVEVPGVPEQEHAVFIGWYTEPNGGGTLYDLSSSNVLPEITENTELDLFAHYTDVYYVYYMEFPLDTVFEEGHENVVFHTEVYNEYDAVLDTSTATDLYRAEGLLAATEAVTGWVDADGNPAPEVVEDDLELYPVIDNAYWVYFDVGEDMNTSVDPIYVLASSTTIGDLPEASCTGYTFDGWYTDTNYRTQVTSSTTLASLNLGTGTGQNDSVTLYAKWTAAKVAYTVNIWRQKATDGAAGISNKTYVSGETYDDFIDYYDFAESFHVTAADSTLYAGDSLASVTPTQSSSFLYQYTRYGTTSDNTSNYYGFEYATNRTQNDVRSITSVAADGSTVINIFYDRVTITWNFGTSNNKTSTGTLIGLYGTNCETDDHYGTLSGWPNTTSSNQIWSYGDSVTFEATFVILDGSTTVNFTTSSFSTNCYGYYYLELTNENQLSEAKEEEANNYKVAYTRQVNDTWYVYDRRINLSGGTFNFTDKYAGYYFAGYNKVSTGSTDNSTSYTEANEGDSDTFRSGFIFYSYYDGYFFNNAIDYTITLVSSDKNVGIADNGTLYDAGNEATYTFKYGTDLSDLTFPGTEDLDGATWGPAYYYEFDGIWMEDPLFTARFVIPSTMPANNLVAYADWELKDVTVNFVTGTEETTFEDQVIKATETAEDPGTPNREGYEFVGWMDQNGKIFNFATVLYEDTTLTALWKDLEAEGYTLTYDLNAANSYGLLDGYEGETTSTNSEQFAAESYEELWTIEKAFPDIASIEGAYDEFICWNTAADGSGTNYYPDDEIEFGNQDITLYAIWANKDRNESTLTLDHNYPEGYTPSEGESTIDEITQGNLTDISLEDESHLTYHEEITVTDSAGETHYYRFEGWSTTRTDVSSATDDDVDFEATDHVAVDTVADESGNTLYAVWLEVYSITVTKEVVNDATNYTVPEDTTFDFTWSVLTGDGETTTGTESGIADKGSFVINDVASGETVTITETAIDGFTVSYNGAQGGTNQDGAYIFTMGEGSTYVTVTNTVETNYLTVNKVWKDANGDEETDVEHDAVTVTVYEDETSLDELILSADNDWADSIELVVKSDATYTVSEDPVDGYNTTVSEMTTDETTGDVGITVTNTEIPYIDIEVTKDWVDDGNRDGLESNSITVQLEIDQVATGRTLTLSESNDWTDSFTNLPKYDENGNEINYSVEETAVPTGYTATYTKTDNGWKITNTHEDYLVSEITITKTWNDAYDQDGKRPESVKFELQVNDSTVTDQNGESWIVELTEDNADANDPDTWTTTITDHPVYVYEEGTQISYTLHEDDVAEGYTTSDGTVTITPVYDENNENIVSYTGDVTISNVHEPEVYGEDGTLTVTKTWDDKDNQDGIRPASVSVTLSAVDSEGEEVALPESVEATQTITANDGWETTYDGLYKYSDGKEITYTVSETAISGYTTTYDPASADDEATGSGAITDGEVTITNTHTPETITVEGSKTWDDSDNQDGKRPESITIRLMADGSPVTEKTVTAADNWVWSFTDLDKYSSGIEIVYTITENAVSDYTTEVNGYDVTNSYTPETTTVTITKEWNDDSNRDGKRPSEVTVTLTGTNSFSQDFTLNDGNSWTTTVDVPMYYNNGELVVYSVSENTVTGYDDPVITSTGGYNFVVTNTYTPELINETGEITVKKAWDDEDDQDGIRPSSVDVTLSAVDSEGTEVALPEDVEATQTITATDNWTVTYEGLYKYANGGKEITYTVTETPIAIPAGHETGYEAEVTGDAANGFTVTNTHEPELVNETGKITVEKVWNDDDNRDGMETAIEVQLYANGSASGDPVSLTGEEDNWTYTWDENLPKYAAGEEITYSVQETGVPEGYTVAYSGDVESGFVITNTHESKTVSDLTITKVWDDKDNQDGIRPESVTVELQIDGSTATDVNGNSWTATLTNEDVDADGNWTITVDDHPVYVDENGAEISYTLHEDTEMEGYEATDGTVVITESTDNDTGITTYTGTATITNTHTPETVDVEGSKTWEYGDDPDTKPASITIRLLADNEEIDSATVTEDDEWAWSFTDLPKYRDGGTEIVYTITEDAVENYTTTYEEGTYDVTNTYSPEETTVTITKNWDDDSNRDGMRPEDVTVTLTGSNKFSEDVTLNDANNWTDTVDVAMYDNSGELVTYDVSEDKVDNYDEPVITSTDGYNFTVTNTHEPEVYGKDGTLTVNKVWVDDDNRDGLETDIVVQLEIDQAATGQTVTLNEDNGWTDTFTGLLKYEDGKEIDYSVEEAAVPDGYTVTYTQNGDDWTITNTHDDYLVSKLTITKVWDDADDQDGIRPESVDVELQIDGSTAKDADGNNWTATMTNKQVDADGNWTVTVTDHPVFLDEEGQQIAYTLHEDNVPEGYEASDGTVVITEDGEGNYIGEVTITNTHTPETVDVEGSKTWDDSDDEDEDRPESIMIRLYADGTEIDSAEVIEEEDWAWNFTDLPKYRDGGVEIAYTITEDAIYHYSTTYDGYDVTNTHEIGKTSVTVQKVWDDVNDYDGARPGSVTIDLLADGEQIDTLELTGDGNVWTGSFTGLDKYDGTTEIEYTIDEEGLDSDGKLADGEYESNITGNAKEGYIIENKHDVTDWSVVKKLTNSGSGENGAFRLGETAQFTITVTNTGNTDIDEIEVTETLDGATFTEGTGYTLNEEKTVATITDLAEGDSVDLYAEYTIEEEDLGKELENSVTTTDGEPEDPEPGDKTPFPTEDPDPHMTVTKTTTSTPENGETYVLGEEITYEITVTNDGNRTLEDITVTDELTGDEWTIDSLAPGASETFEATHEVTEEDILNGSVVNEATASAKDPDNPREDVPDDPGTDEEPTEEKEGHLTVTKEVTSEPANGEAYTYGEEIEYKITVTNDGNLTITGITVTDELTEDEWTIDSLAPGASEEFTTSHKVTMDDVNAGSVTNEATVEGTSPDPDDPDVPSEPGEVETPTEEIDYFPMDEEIVPGNDDEANPGSWIDRESVNEYDAIEIEMSTTLPNVSGTALAEGDYNMTFHNILDAQFVLDEVDSDFTVDINGTPIDHQYYEIDVIQTTGLMRFFSISDGCTFHVNVDLSALYNDGVISDDDLGTGTVRVFFYADLETTDVNGSYTSTAWYDLADGDEVLHTSDKSVVTVYTFEIIVDAIDKNTGAPLAGAEYGLYYDEECTDPVMRASGDEDAQPYIVTTDENGQGMFVGIAEGTYYVKEIVKPDDYESITEPMAVTLVGDADSEHIFEITFPYAAEQSGPDEPEDPEKSADVDTGASVSVGDEINYTITYYNNNDTAAIVTITDDLSDGVDYISSDPAGEYDADTHTVVWTFEAEAFEHGSVELKVQVNEKAAGSELDNTAGVQIGNADTVETNTVGIPVNPEDTTTPDTPQKPEKTADVKTGAKVSVGDEITYTITYYNHNDEPTDVLIVDTLDAGLDFVSADNGGVYDADAHAVTWVISDVAEHTGGVVTLKLKVNENALKEGSIANTASVQIGNDDAVKTNTVGISVNENSTGGSGGTGGTGGTTGTSGTGNVKTGDNNALILYMILLLGCAVLIGGTVSLRRRTVRK